MNQQPPQRGTLRAKNRVLKKLDDEEYIKAEMIYNVYKKPQERKYNVDEFQMDKQFNKTNLVVYESPFKNICIIAIRGTASISDLITDIKLVVQQTTRLNIMSSSSRFKELSRTCIQVYQKYKKINYTVKLTGHSLSGFEVMLLEKNNPDFYSDNTAFNAGSAPLQTYSIPDDVKHIRNPIDPISMGFDSSQKTVHYINQNGLYINPLQNHSVMYFRKNQ
jgi:hypothetical protein